MIIVLNFGSQYTHLIARKVRELGVYSEILPYDVSIEKIASLKPRGIILSGGPASVLEDKSPAVGKKLFSLGIPILGICYGMQLTGKILGGKVVKGEKSEFGKKVLSINPQNELFNGLMQLQTVWFSHGDQVLKAPEGFSPTASTPECKIAAFANNKKKIYGVQFHPEVVHTVNGKRILENFLFKICFENPTWRVSDLADSFVKKIKQQIGREKAIIAISGGVDSIVAAKLMEKAIGNKLYCLFIDTGLMRKKESVTVEERLHKLGLKNIFVVDAKKLFLSKLVGVTDPEEKRKIIGHAFIEVFEQETIKLEKKEHIRFLVQGTIYPDRIESGSTSSATAKIKSHHNLTLPPKMRFQIIEPLKELYKDEVRQLGKSLGIPDDVIYRHPFPGPGLAIRILGEVTHERLKILREADAIFIEELRSTGWYNKVWQGFCALLPVKSVGVKGDSRSYEYVIALRAVSSVDGMTADWSKLPADLLERVSSRIINEVKGANRVLYDISQKPPSTIEYE